ncbi:MAG: hypothetical protein ABFD98_19900 [Syntrophobacteraceae bacterium]|nr:hypothetical protein [Desulfobacteraceae bacterium]
MVDDSRTCDECGKAEDQFSFCETRCMLPSCTECTFLLQLYGTGCGNVRVYYLCRECYDNRIQRGFVEP